MAASLIQPLRGVIPPMITPLADENSLDLPGLKNLIEHILAGGVHGLFLLGTTGEGPSLSSKLKCEMVKNSCKIIAGRVPVLVGITDTSFAESIQMAEHAASYGADAVVLAPPYYFPAGQAELLEYFEHLAPKLPLPLFLYNMPSMTKVSIEVETLRKASNIENIVGFKDSSGNMIKYHEYLKAMQDKPEFSMLIGPEELLGESILFGGHGGIAGGANIKPRLFVDIYEAAVAGDLQQIKKLQKEIFTLRELYSFGQYSSTFIKGVKCSLNCMGICSEFIAEPFRSFRDTERSKIKTLLREMKLLN